MARRYMAVMKMLSLACGLSPPYGASCLLVGGQPRTTLRMPPPYLTRACGGSRKAASLCGGCWRVGTTAATAHYRQHVAHDCHHQDVGVPVGACLRYE